MTDRVITREEFALTQAIGVAELYADILGYLQRDARRLADAAVDHSAAMPIGLNYLTAVDMSVRANALADKIDQCIADMQARLADVVALDPVRTSAH